MTSLDMDRGRTAVPPMDQHPDFRSAVEARVLLEPAIERLSPDQRAVIALHYTIGFSIAEAADVLGIRVGTAKSRLNAALRALRTTVGGTAALVEPETVR